MTLPAARSILLLDLYACEDGFVGDAAIGATGARLRARGSQVELLRSVRDAEAGGPEVWVDRLAREVAARNPDLVVLSRAWDERVPRRLRAVLRPDARLVRLTQGIATALDDRFDHVVDEDGLLRLAQPGTEGEPRPGPPMVATAIDPGASRPRPTISGPASGCPYLVDARRNPLFERAALDASRTQTRGCAFCLDNHGAYAMPTVAEVVGAWLAQWRAHRLCDPQVREVLLTDERPHPFLPAFFQALEREPSLGGVELLFKSRADWLLESGEAELPAALASAERSGSVLHAYLVGFESFDAFHLELFNKGVTVEENVRAIALLRELEQRFPRSFEFRKYRAHGIVLFTPWTRPEALLENARWMRSLRFEELRAESLQTRLRLYPRTALHALAAADGLLAEDFGDRGDRAAEQGYDASVPWRFQDPRTGAIQRIASQLAHSDRSLPEPHVLELATHFVLRWPGLAAAPSDALAVLRHSCALLGPTEAIGPIAATFDPEIELLVMGLKRASLKEGLPVEHAPGLVRGLRAMGLCSEIVGTYDFEVQSGTHRAGSGFATVAVAAREADLDEVVRLQRAHAAGAQAPVGAMGALMGYPPCCVEAFDGQPERGDNLENERLSFLRAPSQPLDPLLNRLARARLVSHHLCSPSCPASLELARAVIDRLGALEPASAAWVRRQLSLALLVLDYDHRIELEGAWEGAGFRVDRAGYREARHGLAFAAESIARIFPVPHGARFELRDGSTRFFDAARPLLLTPGAPLAGPALAAIAPREATPLAPPAALPRLPHAIRVGATSRSHRVASVRSLADHHEVVLARGEERVRLELRDARADHPATLRIGTWAIAVEHPEALSTDARAALSVFVRALAASSMAAGA